MIRVLLAIISRIAIFAIGGWFSLVALFSPALSSPLRMPCAIVLGCLVVFSLFWPRKFFIPAVLGTIAMIFLWAILIPSNDRDWQRDLAKLPWAEQNGDEITIYNVRDFNYRTETDYDERYTTKKVRLSELSELDLFASYWSGKSIAHIFISFGFADHDYVTFSIEVRKTKTQAYSTIEGFFRNFELLYVVAEERDVVALRTIYRQPNEDVYLFRLKYFKENAIKLFLKYIENMNALVKKPAFYNTLTTNCTTQILANAQGAGGGRRFKYDWRVLLSGYTPEYLYNLGNLDTQFSFEELVKKGYVNPRAQDVSSAEQFSKNIREGVPKPQPFTVSPQ